MRRRGNQLAIQMMTSMEVRVNSSTLITVCLLILISLTYVKPQEGQFIIKHTQDPLKDWSAKCRGNALLTVFLTRNMGQSDSEVFVISGNYGGHPNCTIRFYMAAGVTTIMVFEFPDAKLYHRPLNCEGIHIDLYENNQTADIYYPCIETKTMNATLTTVVSTEPLITILVNSNKYFQPLKVTITTSRQLKNGQICDPETEVSCIRQGEIQLLQLCVSIEVQCDGHINCGEAHMYDESSLICNESTVDVLWLVILLAIVLLGFVLFFIMHVIRRVVPHVGNSFFVFNEDEDNRLNLASVFTQPAERRRGRSPQLSSSSYRFRTSSVIIKPSERDYTQDRRSEVEMRSEFPIIPPRRKSALSKHSRKDSSDAIESTPGASVSPQDNDNKKRHLHIAPVSVEVVPDYDEMQPHTHLMTDIPPKPILGHGHDQVSFPISSTYKGPGASHDMEIVKVPKKKKGLKDARSSKNLISHKVHHLNDPTGTEEKPPRPERSHRKSSSDSD